MLATQLIARDVAYRDTLDSDTHLGRINISNIVIQCNLCIMDTLGPTKVSRLSRCPDFPGQFT